MWRRFFKMKVRLQVHIDERVNDKFRKKFIRKKGDYDI